MFKKAFFLYLFILCIVSSGAADESCPDPADIYHTAEVRIKSQYYDKANQLYQQLLDTWPDDEYYAIRGQAGLAKSSVALGNTEAADAAVEKLLADYSDNEHLPTCLCNVAYYYTFFQEYQKARNLYQHVLNNWPDHTYAMWSQVGLIQIDDLLGSAGAVETAVETLVGDYTNHEDIPAAVCNIAQHYHRLAKYQEAKYCYQYTIANWPDHEYAAWARQGLAELYAAEPTDTPDERFEMLAQIDQAKSNIAQGDPNAAQAVIDILLTDHPGNPRLPEAIYDIAKHCVDSAVYEMGADLHQYVLQMWPDHPKVIWARMGLAESYAALGNAEAAKGTTNQMLASLPQTDPFKPDAVWTAAHVYFQLQNYEQAIQYFQQILDDWPDCKYAWSAQSWIGECYEKLKSTGSFPQPQADPLIETAYCKVIENHPNCPLIGHASLKLAYLTAEQTRWPEATAYFELFIEATPDDIRVPYVLYDLGRAYENANEPNLAISSYAQFIEATDPNSPIAEELKARFPQLAAEGGPNDD